MDNAEILGFRQYWELPSPESYALLHGTDTWAKIEALKWAVSELVARKCLTLKKGETRGLFGFARRDSHLLEAGSEFGLRPESRSLQAVLDIVRGLGLCSSPEAGAPRITVERFVGAVREKYGWPAGYADAEVMPSLAERGLYLREDRRLRIPLGLSIRLRTPNWRLTASGERSRQELWQGVLTGEEHFGDWVDEVPERAVQFLSVAGSALLLMGKMREDLHRLNEQRFRMGQPDLRLPEPTAAYVGLRALGTNLETLRVADATFAAMGPVLAFGVTAGLGAGAEGGG